MDIDLIFKNSRNWHYRCGAQSIAYSFGREEQAMMTTLAGLIVVLMMVIQQIDVLFQSIKVHFGL